MSTITVKCPHCNSSLEAPLHFLGKEVECPSCRLMFTLAQPQQNPPKSVSEKKAVTESNLKPKIRIETNPEEKHAEFKIKCPYCNSSLIVSEDMIGEETPCPKCQETIFIQDNIPDVESPNKPETKINIPPVSYNNIHTNASTNFTFRTENHTSVPKENSPSVKWQISKKEADSIQSMFLAWWISALLGIPTFGLGFIAHAVFTLILLYKYWKLVPPAIASTTPGCAVGFLFIPFFQIYWQFVAWYQLTKHYSTISYKNRDMKSLGLCFCILNLLCMIPYVCLILIVPNLIIWIIIMVKMKNIAVYEIPRSK